MGCINLYETLVFR